MVVSVRDSLGVVGQRVSIGELARQRNASFPLSLRKFVGAPPAGRILRRAISLDFLQRKFDAVFNQRPQPLFTIKLDGTDYGQGALTLFFADPVAEGGYKVSSTHEFRRDELDIDIPIPGDHHFYFRDLNSNSLKLNLDTAQPVQIQATLGFETDGPVEIDINNWRDVNLTRFGVTIRFGLEVDPVTHLLILSIPSGSVKTDVSIDSIPVYQSYVESRIRGTVNEKVSNALTGVNELAPLLTRFLVGGDFYVMEVSSDAQTMIIDYILPPGQLEPFPENPQEPLEPRLTANIDHIVVLMMENRSFDHMLGYLSRDGGGDGRKRTDLDGLRGGEKNRYQNHDYVSFLLPGTQFSEDPPHGREPVENQINGGKMDGFVVEFAKAIAGKDPRAIMGYHDATHVPVYDVLAREFLICQRWFAAHPGPTFCNRFYTLTGRLNRDSFGTTERDNPKGDDFQLVFTRTIFDHLTEHGVSWRYYEHGSHCFLRMFDRYAFDDDLIVSADDPTKGFFASAQAGSLPSVSFIDPNFIELPDGQDNADGPPADIAAGQNLIGRIVNAVIHSPKWAKTLLLITYDEHGGFYDHVNPLDFSQNAKPVSGIEHYGVRVPALVVSPWVDRGAVSNVVFDHTSIAKTIARRFMSSNPPDMGERMAAANDLSSVLRSTPRQDLPSIPLPAAPVQNVALAPHAPPSHDSDDFRDILRVLHSRYPESKIGA